MSSEHCAIRKIFEDFFSRRNVGGQHELLHHRVRLENLFGLDVDRVGSLAVNVESVLEKNNWKKTVEKVLGIEQIGFYFQ